MAASPRPDVADLITEGIGLARSGRLAEAEGRLRAAADIAPQHAPVWANLGTLLGLMKRPDEATACYRQALALAPQDVATRRNLAVLLRQAGETEESMEVLQPAADTTSTDLALPAHLALAAVSQSRADIARQREAFGRGLDALAARGVRLAAEPASWSPPTFPLAYHGLDDRALMSRTAEVLGAVVDGLTYRSPQLDGWRAPGGRRVRLAFVSDHLASHTVGRVYQGLIQQLDRSGFEVVVAHATPAPGDPVRAAIDQAADAAMVLPQDLAGQRAAIEQIAPDILFYPDIGMSGSSYRLAFSRLAPVQLTAWGHPDTTGLPSIDYYLSTERFEPPGAQAHYSERLVQLRNVPCCLEPPARTAEAIPREHLGLPARGRLYGCPQTVYKLHPDFDAVLARIAAADPEGWIVIPEPHEPTFRQALMRRWRGSVLNKRVHFLPRAPLVAFMAQLREFDVLLDPLHFGSGYTFYLAMAEGAPTVTLPGAFARGRMAQGFYAQMGAGAELVAADPEAYAAIALDLAHSPSRQRELRDGLREAALQRLYRDTGVVRELEAFLLGALSLP